MQLPLERGDLVSKTLNDAVFHSGIRLAQSVMLAAIRGVRFTIRDVNPWDGFVYR
jgi:hypothetical protein